MERRAKQTIMRVVPQTVRRYALANSITNKVDEALVFEQTGLTE